MSFSSQIKEELSKLNNYKNSKIIEAEFLGYMLTANILTKNNIFEFITENEFNIERFYKILFNLEIDYEPEIRGKTYIAIIKQNEKTKSLLNLNINPNDDEKRAIVRGAFLSAGRVTEPSKSYHLEIVFNEKNNADYILNICTSYNILLKILENEGKYVIYLKDADLISSFLALIGASKSVLLFEDVRVTKEIKNNINRLVNCETANLNKVINASVDQINDIKLIQKLKKFDELPDYLKEIAIVRLENPDSSLKDLGELLDKPLGKSGVNHRLKKIHELAEELRIKNN